MSDEKWKGLVYRLEGVPSHVDTLAGVASLLSERFGNLEVSDIDVRSLATSLYHWVRPAPRVATLQFRSVPDAIRSIDPTLRKTQWDLSLCCGCDGLTLDSDFLGLTPLNDLDEMNHVFDCIAVSGLASHPFGCWQPHGPDKTFMWIRDESPTHVPGMRAILYGHNTSLVDGWSTQVFADVAKDLIETLGAGGWRQPSSKPLVFLAHSLGGLILKDFFVRLADARDLLNRDIVAKIRGAIMFGVPNLGMDQSSLVAIVEGQPNETLVQDLKPSSNYLLKLDKSFTGTSFLSEVQIFWAYETRLSPTAVKKSDGNGWERAGPPSLLVDSYSATCRLEQKDPSKTFPIPENHSDMVKFSRNSPSARIIYFKLRHILSGTSRRESRRSTRSRTISNTDDILFTGPWADDARDKSPTKQEVLNSLSAQGLNLRIDLISDRQAGTIEWIYRNTEFTNWLRSGTGMYWIHGKPGSGKSTLMKFLFKDRRTVQFASDFGGIPTILAGFFFYYRGTSMQKSLEGLLRSIICHTIQNQAHLPLHTLLAPLFDKEGGKWYGPSWTFQSLMKALHLLLDQDTHDFHLRLFLDALDEFDGPRLLICQFLNSMFETGAKFAKRVAICFSSRPEVEFVEYFNRWPSLTLQLHTSKDIRNYCMESMASRPNLARTAKALVPEITERASGVFLWVRLVIGDLERVARSVDTTFAELRDRLSAIPLDLQEYYEEIIQRISPDCRWETYVLLDLVIQTSQLSTNNPCRLNEIWRTVSISTCHNFEQAQRVIDELMAKEFQDEKIQMQDVMSWGGGLVEIYRNSGGYYVEVMHQTVYEFVTSLRFKEVVLGAKSKETYDNGHLFYAKYLLTSEPCSPSTLLTFGNHARAAEATCGLTMMEFMTGTQECLYPLLEEELCHAHDSRLQKSTKWRAEQNISSRVLHTPLSFAVSFSLRLFLTECLDAKKDWQADNEHPLLFFSLLWLDERPYKEFLDMASLLLDAGYRPIARRTSDPALPPGDMDVLGSLARKGSHMSIDIAKRIIDSGPPGNELSTCRVLVKGLPPRCAWKTPLHISTLHVAAYLLEKGIDPNCVDSDGYTALDGCFLAHLETFGDNAEGMYGRANHVFSALEIYELASLLVRHGCRFVKMPSADISIVLGRLKEQDYDISVFSDFFDNRGGLGGWFDYLASKRTLRR